MFSSIYLWTLLHVSKKHWNILNPWNWKFGTYIFRLPKSFSPCGPAGQGVLSDPRHLYGHWLLRGGGFPGGTFHQHSGLTGPLSVCYEPQPGENAVQCDPVRLRIWNHRSLLPTRSSQIRVSLDIFIQNLCTNGVIYWFKLRWKIFSSLSLALTCRI